MQHSLSIRRPVAPSLPIFTRSSASSQDATSQSSQSSNSQLLSGVWMESKNVFPVNRVYCVGRNYRDHAIEMGHDPDREPPFFFMKPANAVKFSHVPSQPSTTTTTTTTSIVPYPPMTSNLHFEAELVVAIGKTGHDVSVEEAQDFVWGYSLGCDLTRRDLQAEAKKMGRPWTTAKAFDCSAPCGPLVPAITTTPDSGAPLLSLRNDLRLVLEVNGEVRQESSLDKMTWNIPEVISHLSRYFCLDPGDLIMTGTPAGVGALEIGDTVKISCGDIPTCDFKVGPPLSP